MQTYQIDGKTLDSVDLKCLAVGRGVRVTAEVYRAWQGSSRLSVNPLCCNCMILPDGTVVQMTDVGFHLKYLTGILSWDNLKLLRYAADLATPFTVRLREGNPALFWQDQWVTDVSFPPPNDFYRRKTGSGLPFVGNAVIQGQDWVAFPCLWPCEFAACGQPCEFCFPGGGFETLTRRGRPQPAPVSPEDVADIVAWAVTQGGCRGVQITGGSTLDGKREQELVPAYLRAIDRRGGIAGIPAGVLLYITPPRDPAVVDEFFALGVRRVACSLEVWNEDLACRITPGKIRFAGRRRYLDTLEHIAGRYGPNKAFSNLIAGLEPVDSFLEGAAWLARRGIVPTASVWMPMGRPVQGTMKPPELDFYRRVKEGLGELYLRHGLEPHGERGLNVCLGADILRWAREGTA